MTREGSKGGESGRNGPSADDTLTPPRSSSRTDRWFLRYPRAVPIALFVAIVAITAFSVYAIETNARAREKAQASEYAQSIASALDRRGNSFSSYLRAGAALFSSLDTVSPQTFRQFVSELRLDVDYRGAEGIGWIEVLRPDEVSSYIERNRAHLGQFAAIRPDPTDDARLLAPVTYFSPDTARNRRALGFDMYSEPVRAAAMDDAKRTVRPTASGKIVLAQEGSGDAPGFVLFMPAYSGDPATRDSRESLAGFVYSPFNAAQFLDSAMEQNPSIELGVRLYDGEAASENLLVSRSLPEASVDRIEQPVTIANRELLLVVETPANHTLAPLSMATLLFGLALASLLMLLARLLTRQAHEDLARLTFFEEQHSIRNSLSRELNHRVKNTLANVLSILSLTRRRADSLDDFADSLEGRIRALSATHDLLTGTDWGTTPMQSVVEAELQHLRTSGDEAFTIAGPPVELAPNDALSFGLAIHELATNAAKFGALSASGGIVNIQWHIVEDHLAEVEWRESGGPPVSEDRTRGFGTELIEKIVAHELKQPVKLEFHPHGVHCVMRVPVRRRSEFQIRQKDQEN